MRGIACAYSYGVNKKIGRSDGNASIQTKPYKNKNKMKKLTLAVLAVGILSCAIGQAATINGSISFIGSAQASGASGAGATTVTFTSPFTVVNSTGDYAGNNGQTATFTNFT